MVTADLRLQHPASRFSKATLLGIQLISLLVALPLVWLTLDLMGSRPSTKSHARIDRERLIGSWNFDSWRALPVQEGREKPFEISCEEIVRQITGRGWFEGLDPVAVFMSWKLAEPERWENTAFLLCDHHGVRHVLLSSMDPKPPADWTRGKYVSPAELRSSVAFAQLVKEASQIRRDLQGRAHLQMSIEQLKAEEVARRLSLYDGLRGDRICLLQGIGLVRERVIELESYADAKQLDISDVAEHLRSNATESNDPLKLVGLDPAPQSSWFSLADLRLLSEKPELWNEWMQKRVLDRPTHYLQQDQLAALGEWNDAVRTGRFEEALQELSQSLDGRRQAAVTDFDSTFRSGDREATNRSLQRLLQTEEQLSAFYAARAEIAQQDSTAEQLHAACLPILAKMMLENDLHRLQALQRGAKRVIGERLLEGSPEFDALGLDYLEIQYPNLYLDVSVTRPFPAPLIERGISVWDAVKQAYQDGNLQAFATESNNCQLAMRTITNYVILQNATGRTSDAVLVNIAERARDSVQAGDWRKFDEIMVELDRPAIAATTTGFRWYSTGGWIAWERVLHRWQPFRWAWVAMLGAVSLLLLSLGLQNRYWYRLAVTIYAASLVLQLAGFTLRTLIAGRAPVANMYETVIFVAFMSAVFALLLEAVYRSRVIGIAGALVATLGLILADQLPLALDPKISPMVPVLRTNFWLTVHVLTIVAAYAGATLAWGLGNVSLTMLAFGRDSSLTVQMLGQFTYRAMQIAVLLLATGTLLGGCWAAESWGRFWGWDPKEVGALVALVCYVIPLHARYIGWVRDFGLAVSAVLCYASILLSWYVINFVLAAGLHSYGFSTGGGKEVLLATCLNLEWIAICAWVYGRRARQSTTLPDLAT